MLYYQMFYLAEIKKKTFFFTNSKLFYLNTLKHIGEKKKKKTTNLRRLSEERLLLLVKSAKDSNTSTGFFSGTPVVWNIFFAW